MEVGISLGWNCEPAMKGVENGVRQRKKDGYNTCPFDECITNYQGIIQCLKDNFKYFCSKEHLKLISAPISTGQIRKGEKLLVNTKYNFIFNHESPGHGKLFKKQKWENGKNHYIDNDYKLFIKRYENRILNFKNYLNNKNNITFILSKFDKNTDLLNTTIKNLYPNLKYKIWSFKPSVKKIQFENHLYIMNNLIK